MPKLQLTALAQRVTTSDPLDATEQKSILDRLEAVASMLDHSVSPQACDSLDGALLLMEYMAQMGGVGGREVLSVVQRLIANAHNHLISAESLEPQVEPGRGLVLNRQPSGGLSAVGDMLLGEIMVKKGMIRAEQIDDALRVAQTHGIRFGEALMKNGTATWSQVEEALKYQDSCRNLTQGVMQRQAGTSKAAGSGPEQVTLKLSDEEEVDKGLRLMSDVLLGEVMVKNNLITKAQLDDAVASHRATGMRMGEALVNLGYCTFSDIKYAIQLQGQMRRYAS